MAEVIGVVGRSGTGKTRSVMGLDPKETLIISVSGKAIPMKGFKKLYTPLNKEGKGNYHKTSKADEILQILNLVDKKRPDIKNVVIDDYQYIMGFEFFDRADEKGFDKFASIGKNGARPVIKAANLEREDLKVFVLTHEEEVSENFRPLRKMKTIGKMVDEKLSMEGLFTIVLFTDIRKDEADNVQYGLITHSDGSTTAKSPEGMFDDDYIPNDLGQVAKAIDDYYGAE